MRWAIAILGLALGCTKGNTGLERCGQSMPCSSMRAYRFCGSGEAGGGRYVLGDFEIPCANAEACRDAETLVTQWCTTGLTPDLGGGLRDLGVGHDLASGLDLASALDFATAALDLAQRPDLAGGGCVAHADCPSDVCDLRPEARRAQCIAESDVVYVEKRNTCTGENGSRANPWCEITTALDNLGGKTLVRVASGTYGRIDRSANVTAFLFGSDRGGPSVIAAGTGGQAVNLYTGSNIVLGFDRFEFQGNSDSFSGGSTVYIDGIGGTGALTIRNSRIVGGLRGVRNLNSTLTVSETIISGTVNAGASLETGSRFSLENNIFAGCGNPAVSVDAAAGGGAFRFNTLSGNGSGTNAGALICNHALVIESSIVSGNAKSATGSQFGGTGGCSLLGVVTGDDTIGNTGKLPGTPVFRSASDLRLDVGAGLSANQGCCIDKIAPAPMLPVRDIEREARPIGTGWDVGADEAM